MFRFSRALASSIALMASVGACAPIPGHAPGVSAAPAIATPATAATGTLRLDPSQWFGGAKERRTLGYGLAADRVTHVRLRIQAPGSSASTLLTPTPVPFDTSSTINRGVECTITAGPNQVVTVEALDASGVMLMRLRGATNVPANGVTTVRVGMTQDLVARIIEKLITDGAPYLADDTLIGSLTTFVTDVVAHTGSAPQYFAARNFTDNFSTWDEVTTWLTREELASWLANPDSLELVGSGYPSSGPAWHLALNDLADPSDYPSEDYDPTQWQVSLIAPINGVWNYYENLAPEYFDGGDQHPYSAGHYFRIGGMPPETYTLLVTHPTNDTKLVFDLGGGYDGPFYFDARKRI